MDQPESTEFEAVVNRYLAGEIGPETAAQLIAALGMADNLVIGADVEEGSSMEEVIQSAEFHPLLALYQAVLRLRA